MATSIELDKELEDRIQSLAGRRKRTAQAIMREAITEYVNREEAREQFKEKAASSWQEYQETGQHLTGEEVLKWLDGWGTAAETAPHKSKK